MWVEADGLINGMGWSNLTNELALNFTDDRLAGGIRISFNAVINDGPYLPGSVPKRRISRRVYFPVNLFSEGGNDQ
jgi:hypothetical protein